MVMKLARAPLMKISGLSAMWTVEQMIQQL
jgi:hypothetical protein